MQRTGWAAAVLLGLTVGTPVVAHAATTSSTTAKETPDPAGTVKRVAAAVATAVPARTAPSSEHAAAVTAPAPTGSAEAAVLKVGTIAAISHTQATAGSSAVSSTADPLEIGGKPLSTQFGGTQSGAGSASGALIDTGAGKPIRIAVTPWTAQNQQSATSSSASALADILVLDLGDPATAESASVRLLQSKSDASWTQAASSGSSSSDGAIVNLGGPAGLTVDLLHSDTSSSGQGSSYLLSLNGTPIGSSQQANGACVITVPSLLSLNCLSAGGGAAGSLSTAASGVLTATLGSGTTSLTAAALSANSSAGTAAPAATPPAVAAGSSGAPGSAGSTVGAGTGSAGAAASGASTSSGSLPFTGLDGLAMVAAAMTLTAAGGLILVSSRRKPAPAV